MKGRKRHRRRRANRGSPPMLGRNVSVRWALHILRDEWGWGLYAGERPAWPTRRHALRYLRQVRRNARLASLTARRNRAALEEAHADDAAREWNPIEDALEADR